MKARAACRVLGAEWEFRERPFLKPLLLSTGAITTVTEIRTRVRISAGVREAEGRGSIYLSDLWAWPGTTRSHEQKDASLRAACARIGQDLPAWCGHEAAHPLELGLRLHEQACAIRGDPSLPALALAMCASPYDAGIHDAAGIAQGCSAFDLYGEDTPIPSGDRWFPGAGACRAIRSILRPLQTRFDRWWIVGAGDRMDDDLAPVVRDGCRAFKLKLPGRDPGADARRTAEVFRAAVRCGAVRPRLTVDTNEANPDADSVRDYLERLQTMDADAFAALEYLEQPTARDLARAAFDWRPVTRLKPVLLDEGLTGMERFETARQQGWSGFALKTCKGHSFALVAAAWARANGMSVSLQDLTNPGLSAIHAALFVGRVETLNGVELNSPQYTPEANRDWLPRLAGLLEPRGGVHVLDGVDPTGLGSRS